MHVVSQRRRPDARLRDAALGARLLGVPPRTNRSRPRRRHRRLSPLPCIERPAVAAADRDRDDVDARHADDAPASVRPRDACRCLVHGVPHEEAVERFKRADIVVDQMHYLWHGVFAIESMAYGKPVVTLDVHYTLPDFAREAAGKSFVLAHTPPAFPPPPPAKPAD